MAVDLIFESAPFSAPPINLVFGEVGAPPITDITLGLSASLPALAGGIGLALIVDLDIAATLPGLTGGIAMANDNQTQRPTVNQVTSRAQIARPIESGLTQPQQHAQATSTGVRHQAQDAVYAHVGTAPTFSNALPAATQTAGRSEDGTPARSSLHGKFQDGHRDRRPSRTSHAQSGQPRRKNYTGKAGPARPVNLGHAARYQTAWPPRAGISQRPVTPVVPVPYWGTALVFRCPPLEFPALVFGLAQCPPTEVVVVPIREVYMVLNEVSLRRVDTDTMLPTFNMSLSLDVDSYTWSLSASLPGSTLGDLQPAFPGDPVLLEALINGVGYRFLVNSISRERQFAQSGVRVGARGLLSTLDSPFVPSMYFGNAEARTAQQLMGDVLTLNGIPLDWTVAWGLTDWSVPGGIWTHTGSYISALNNIAQAAGGYIQPHASLQTLYVKPRYPDGPWNWSALTPDFEIPAAVATTESIEWVDKAVYNRVYVSGEVNGVLGVITRAGTAGDLVAQMVTDPLITEGLAARQRGLSILSDTGLQANVTLRMPVLTETGILVPGHLIDYVDGGTTRRGIVRSTQVSVGGQANVWQSIGVETHV